MQIPRDAEAAVIQLDSSRGFGCPQRYIQGPGEFENIFLYAREYGQKPLFLIDGGIYPMVSARILEVQDKAECAYETFPYSGESCMEAVAEIADQVRSLGCDLLIGVGGGKVLDTAKLVGDELDLPRIIVPTAASSDAPAADWAAIYTRDGVHLMGRRTRRSTELVLVDSEIIVHAPARLFSAGIGDALATWFEARACERSRSHNCVAKGYLPTRTALALSRECYDILMHEGIQALRDVKAHVVTPEVEDVIEANTLLSGLGFINGGLAAAHGLHSGFSEASGGERSLHGEKVAFALLCQLVLESATEDVLWELMNFLFATDLPLTLEQLGIQPTEENLRIIADKTCKRNTLIHHEPLSVDEDRIRQIVLEANALGHHYLADRRKEGVS